MEDGSPRRRTVLASAAAVAASLAGCGNPLSDSGDGGTPTDDRAGTPTATNGSSNGTTDTDTQDGNDTSPDDDDPVGEDDASTTIRLGGDPEGWSGVEPEQISGETNPTLKLEAGTTYELVWDNLDGEEHELILADGNGEEVAASEESATEGETVSMEFTAAEELAEYFCEYHPDAMRGEIEVVAGE